VVLCDECTRIYDGDPPCDTDCDMPKLMPENEEAWVWWAVLNEFDRPASETCVNRISATTMVNLCDKLGLSKVTFIKMLKIEDAVFPNIVRQYKEALKRFGNKEKKWR